MRSKCKRVSIISRESNSRTLDVAMLESELLRRGADVTVLSRLLTKDRSLRSLAYAGHVLRQEAAILASDVVVLDTYCIPASMLPHRKGTKVVQMWHALGAIKKFGWQTVGKEGGSSEKVARLMKMHHGYDYVVSPSDVTSEYFCEAFNTDRSRIVKYGLPRIDYIRSVAGGSRQADTAARITAKYPQLKRSRPGDRAYDDSASRKTVLYAPTFRPGRTVDPQPLIDALGTDRYNIVIKLHPVYRGASAPANAEVIYDDDFSSNDWLSVADIVISDYSSFVIESTLADRPLFIYAYDIEDYEASTGLNIDFESEPIAPYVFRDAETLASAVEAACTGGTDPCSGYDIGALRSFRDRYIDIDIGGADEEYHCTSALADFILSLAE